MKHREQPDEQGRILVSVRLLPSVYNYYMRDAHNLGLSFGALLETLAVDRDGGATLANVRPGVPIRKHVDG